MAPIAFGIAMRSLEIASAARGAVDGSMDTSVWYPASICCTACIMPGRPPEKGEPPAIPPLGGGGPGDTFAPA
mgnify:CR=1 FL=1